MSNNSSSLFILIKSSDLQKEMKVSHKTGAELFVVFTKKDIKIQGKPLRRYSSIGKPSFKITYMHLLAMTDVMLNNNIVFHKNEI